MAIEQDPFPDHLSALPTELRCAVARDARNILGLTHPASNIIKHVQNINLLPGSPGTYGISSLLAVIPRGQLKGFTSVDHLIQSTLELLLLLHPRLIVLEVPTRQSLGPALTSPWTVGSWAELRSMVIHTNCLNSTAFQAFWNVCENLKHLEFRYDHNAPSAPRMPESIFDFKSKDIGPASTTEDIARPKTGGTTALRLETLRIGKDVYLPRSLDSMLRRIDTLVLHELSLDTFTEPTELLEAMAPHFAKGQPCLKKLTITNLPAQSTDRFVQGLFVFLVSFCGLHTFHLHCLNCHKIDVDGIANHGEYLQNLFLINGGIHRRDATRSFDATDLQKLAVACPKLEHLSLNLYETGQHRNEGDILGSLSRVAHTPNAFEEAMRAIADFTALRTLRLSNPPGYRKAFHTSGELLRTFPVKLQNQFERHNYQARADGIIQFLGQHGSSIEGLAFVPTEALKKADGPDQKGHVWPNYYYYRGDMKDRKGRDVAVARPFVDWNDEFPDAAV